MKLENEDASLDRQLEEAGKEKARNEAAAAKKIADEKAVADTRAKKIADEKTVADTRAKKIADEKAIFHPDTALTKEQREELMCGGGCGEIVGNDP